MNILIALSIVLLLVIYLIKFKKSTKNIILAKHLSESQTFMCCEIESPLKPQGEKNEFHLRLINANLKITIDEEIPHLESFIGNQEVSKHVKTGKPTKNNIAFDKNDKPFLILMNVLNKQGEKIEINDYVGSFFPFDGSGHCMMFSLKNKEDLKNVSKIEIHSEKPIKADLVFRSYSGSYW